MTEAPLLEKHTTYSNNLHDPPHTHRFGTSRNSYRKDVVLTGT